MRTWIVVFVCPTKTVKSGYFYARKNAENVMDGILWNRTHFQYYNSEYIGELEFAFIQPNDGENYV